MEPWVSWGIAIVVGGLAFLYYNSQKKPQATRVRTASTAASAPTAPKVTRKREDVKTKPKSQAAPSSGVEAPRVKVETGSADGFTSGADPNKKRKVAKKQQAPAAVAQPSVARSSQPDDDDEAEGDDTKAWAQGLLALKKGTSLAPPSRTDSRGRTVKQSAANFSSTSSNAADADDDLSPALSPALAAGGVSDMLEPASSGPSVLRLTESSKPAKANQQRQQQTAAQAAETKKQRQNRQKVEDRRIAREQEEKERLVLLETQRRVARESRGEPARNGVVSSKPPAASEWAVRAANRALQAPTEPHTSSPPDNGGLLDTFTEDDQLSRAKKLSENESGWNTVPKGKKQKKRTQPNDALDSTGSESGANTSYEQPAAPVAAPVVPTPAPALVSKPTSTHTNGYQSLYSSSYDAGSHPEDSPWSA